MRNLRMLSGKRWTTFAFAGFVLMSAGLHAQSVCARVRVHLSQEAVMTRTVFRASLAVENTSDASLDGPWIRLEAYHDAEGSRVPIEWSQFGTLFDVEGPVISTASPNLSAFDGTGHLSGGERATATWTFIPTRHAAPTRPERYYIGGEIGYTDASDPSVNPGAPPNPLSMPATDL